ncbi:MAG: sulfate adenylyltransferase small subunit [Bacteroidetes bacterium GWF2_49_14]|nr:MAG: sulfate adenylyltransferase small subunit [Bacteroidetes bacterium GWF2_49_14]HBB93742.1 sulfate adenylyltransferase subunit CysD [Bacteroidales bacterium]
MTEYRINHLGELENESIYVMREVAAQFENPALLFSGGKDSIVMVHLARKAFWPQKLPFTLVHIDTGHNFEETLTYRDDLVEKLGARLVVGLVQESIDNGFAVEETGFNASRNVLQTVTLLQTIEKYKFDVAIGGGRRDEEKARAKERFFSHRDEFGQWDPKNQRPELWNIFNGRHHMGEHFRAFPLSNWTEMDVWQYIFQEKIEMPSLYYTHRRKAFLRDGVWLAWAPFMKLKPTEQIVEHDFRCRTIGDITCTGLTKSKADTLVDIIREIAATRVTERGGRFDDRRSEAAMEDRKKEGYF